MLACKSKQDLLQAEQEGKCAAILTVEGGAVLAGDLSRVKVLADCGVGMLTLTWNGSCELGDGAMVTDPKGLTEFGQAVIPELERHDILLDVSHASELFSLSSGSAGDPAVSCFSFQRQSDMRSSPKLNGSAIPNSKRTGRFSGTEFLPVLFDPPF